MGPHGCNASPEGLIRHRKPLRFYFTRVHFRGKLIRRQLIRRQTTREGVATTRICLPAVAQALFPLQCFRAPSDEALDGLTVMHAILSSRTRTWGNSRNPKLEPSKEARGPRSDSTPAGIRRCAWVDPRTMLLATELLFGPRLHASDRTPPHRKRTKASLEGATPPDWQAPPANHREHHPRLTVSLPVNARRPAA